MSTISPSSFVVQSPTDSGEARIWAAAEALETNFLTEVLKSAGVGSVPDTFGGGVGEDQFSSFLREEQARQMVAAGGIGLAQALFEAMAGRNDA